VDRGSGDQVRGSGTSSTIRGGRGVFGGRPRPRLTATIWPSTSSSPPQTPYTSARSSAPARQVAASPHLPQIALARAMSNSSSEKNRWANVPLPSAHRAKLVPTAVSPCSRRRARRRTGRRGRPATRRRSASRTPRRRRRADRAASWSPERPVRPPLIHRMTSRSTSNASVVGGSTRVAVSVGADGSWRCSRPSRAEPTARSRAFSSEIFGRRVRSIRCRRGSCRCWRRLPCAGAPSTMSSSANLVSITGRARRRRTVGAPRR
jgi:hypothetical protein